MNSSNSGSSGSSSNQLRCPTCQQCPPCQQQQQQQQSGDSLFGSIGGAGGSDHWKFPDSLSNMFVDYATVPRDSFTQLFDVGVPLDDTKKGAEDVLVLYSHSNTKPYSGKRSGLSAGEATQNCNTLKLLLAQPGQKQCYAFLPQWESYYVHKYMRLPTTTRGGLDKDVPLRYVSRTHNDKGQSQGTPQLQQHTNPFYAVLKEYLEHLPRLVNDLKGILDTNLTYPPNAKRGKTVLVQVCNYGQVELFHNFVCTAKARNIPIQQSIMFATDQATYDLCQKLGIPAFYDESIFGDLPEKAARGYGDKNFSQMMLAKVYCVHLVLSAGYNVLFQDVDVVWYKNPLPYFDTSPEVEEWDMMFQDDGARSARYAPYSPNTGFYFVRHNERTVYFFGMLLRSGDNVAKVSSHQAALTALLNEHVSLKGLRVKVWHKGGDNPFPGGVEYHQKKDFMKDLLKRKLSPQPYLFHMSWTLNKDNKKKYFQQMGEWHIKENCLTGYDCCLKEPNVVCHYRDKPSIIPCTDSPPIDKGRPSFW